MFACMFDHVRLIASCLHAIVLTIVNDLLYVAFLIFDIYGESNQTSFSICPQNGKFSLESLFYEFCTLSGDSSAL